MEVGLTRYLDPLVVQLLGNNTMVVGGRLLRPSSVSACASETSDKEKESSVQHSIRDIQHPAEAVYEGWGKEGNRDATM